MTVGGDQVTKVSPHGQGTGGSEAATTPRKPIAYEAGHLPHMEQLRTNQRWCLDRVCCEGLGGWRNGSRESAAGLMDLGMLLAERGPGV
eukprot:6114799-Pyramimonas_sp.AAC.1